MDIQQLVDKLTLRQPLFDAIPPIAVPRICGLESEYGFEGQCYLPEKFYSFLSNGGLLYMDRVHPEYCTPEVSNPLSAVLYYEAGKILSQERKFASRLYCNNNSWSNSDLQSISQSTPTTFGAHESYATRATREVWEKLVPFLVARTVMCGNGWINTENRFEISQRANFITKAIDSETVNDRAILNTRWEPLMNHDNYDRLHIICGDATMNEVATLLRVGTMSMVVEMLELNALPKISYNHSKAVMDIRGISLRTSDWYLGGLQSGNRNLVSFLNLYYEKAHSLFSKRDLVSDLVLWIWKDTLEKLGSDPMKLGYRLDWVAKLILLDSFNQERGCNADWLRSQDMEYHNLHPDEGLYYLLKKEGQAERLFTDRLVTDAMYEPPTDTRAFARGKLIQYISTKGVRYGMAPGWDQFTVLYFFGHEHHWKRNLDNPFHNYAELVEEAKKQFI